jgi:hypothetical protein
MKRIRSKGISQIELIVICVCCLIASALSITIVQQSREKSRMATCQDKLRALVISAHNYHDSHKRIPAGTLGSKDLPRLDEWESGKWKDQQFTSSFGLMMPFMDMLDEYNSFELTAADYRKDLSISVDQRGNRSFQWFGEFDGYPKAYTTEHASNFQCPSDNDFSPEGIEFVIAMHPVYEMDPEEKSDSMWAMTLNELKKLEPSTADWGTKKTFTHTNYLACAGAHSGGNRQGELGRYTGPMTTRDKFTLEVLSNQDGSSRTFMFGETIGEFKDKKRSQITTFLTGGLGRGRGLAAWGEEPTESAPMLGTPERSSVHGFGSTHGTTSNFALCDGATRSISHKVDMKVFYNLCGRNDGNEIDMQALFRLR